MKKWTKSCYASMVDRQNSIPGATYDIPDYENAEKLPRIPKLRMLAKVLISRLVERHIVIVGDYDADGVMSMGIMLKGLIYLTRVAESLTNKKASTIELVVPDRFTDGYGFQIEQAQKIKDSVILLLDNGISQNDAIQVAVDNNNEVFVVDHHEPGETLPKANIIVNPHAVKGGEFDDFCAAGLSYRLIRAMFEDPSLGIKPEVIREAMEEFLFMAAIATVADVVSMIYENRVIVKNGLKKVPDHWKTITYTLLGQKKDSLNEVDVSFNIAPAINAAGRLGKLDADFVYKLITEKDTAQIADDMLYMNTLRKEETKKAMKEFGDLSNLDDSCFVYVAQKEDIHAGVVGIVAGQISDKISRPVFIFGPEKDGMVTGSARAPKNTIHLKILLDKINQEKPGLLVKYGGHEGAAGVTVKKECLAEFETLTNTYGKYEKVEEEEVYDFELPNDGNAPDWNTVYNGIASFGPFGEMNPPPVLKYTCTCRPQDISFIGKGETLKIRSGMNEILGFGMGKRISGNISQTLECYGVLGINNYKGGRIVQMKLVDVVPVEKKKTAFNGKLAI